MNKTDYSELGDFALRLTVIFERLRRIEEHLGISEPTPGEAEFDRRAAEEEDE